MLSSLPCLRICGLVLYTELFYAIIPTWFLSFLLICYPNILLYFECFFIFVNIIIVGKFNSSKFTVPCTLPQVDH